MARVPADDEISMTEHEAGRLHTHESSSCLQDHVASEYDALPHADNECGPSSLSLRIWPTWRLSRHDVQRQVIMGLVQQQSEALWST